MLYYANGILLLQNKYLVLGSFKLTWAIYSLLHCSIWQVSSILIMILTAIPLLAITFLVVFIVQFFSFVFIKRHIKLKFGKVLFAENAPTKNLIGLKPLLIGSLVVSYASLMILVSKALALRDGKLPMLIAFTCLTGFNGYCASEKNIRQYFSVQVKKAVQSFHLNTWKRRNGSKVTPIQNI